MTTTLDQIITAVRQHRPCSRRQVIRWLDAVGIGPVGVRQRPQRYPMESAAAILAHLGLVDQVPATRLITVAEAKRRAKR